MADEPDDDGRPPMPPRLAAMLSEGYPVIWDEESSQWIVGDDPGMDLDDED